MEGRPIAVCVEDLLFVSKIREAARSVGCAVVFLSADSPDVFNQLNQMNPGLILVDLALRRTDPVEWIRNIHARLPQTPLVAFGAHVREDLLQEASAAGCSKVLARSKFVQELLPMMTEYVVSQRS